MSIENEKKVTEKPMLIIKRRDFFGIGANDCNLAQLQIRWAKTEELKEPGNSGLFVGCCRTERKKTRALKMIQVITMRS